MIFEAAFFLVSCFFGLFIVKQVRNAVQGVFGRPKYTPKYSETQTPLASAHGRPERSMSRLEMQRIEDDWQDEDSASGTSTPLGRKAGTHGVCRVQTIHGVPTEYIRLAASDDAVARQRKGSALNVLLVVPGNPGNSHYYTLFADTIRERTAGQVEIVIVSHAGHSAACYASGRVFNLDEQIQHKLDFLSYFEKRYHKDLPVNWFFSGHSVGSYVCMRMLKALRLGVVPTRRVSHTFGLFPTVMDIGSSPNGVNMRLLFWPVSRYAVACVAGILSVFPKPLVKTLLRLHLGDHPNTVDATSHLLNFSTANNAIYMAGREMREIRDIEPLRAVMSASQENITMYFGVGDQWCPLSYYEYLHQQFPKARMIVDQDGLRHAFVIGGSRLMGEKMAEWLRQLIKADAPQGITAANT